MDRAAKPLDAGSGRVCASFDPVSAAWLSIGMPHETHGFVELSAAPRFEESARGDPAVTRAHRRALTDGEYAFLFVELAGRSATLEPVLTDAAAPGWTGSGIRVTTRAAADASTMAQSWELVGAGEHRVEVRLSGRLDRPALAEITETDPPPVTGARTNRWSDGSSVVLEAGSLPARATIAVSGTAVRWTDAGDERFVGRIEWPVDTDRLRFELSVTLEPTVPAAITGSRSQPSAAGDRLTDRALAYIRGCTALRTGPDERAILTDHRLLQLSWTRDAYWQALALLLTGAPDDQVRVADHLRWLWRRCDRPEGWWARSHHADGRRKDLAFQADQQLYPILELADYWRAAGSLPAGVDWAEAVARAWRASEARVDGRLQLLASGENAADDPSTSPFIGAAQILRWWTATRISELATAGVLDVDPSSYLEAARTTRAAFAAAFERGADPWPYAVDAAGSRQAYHDANDLPVALAPSWGFCRVDDPGWRATMDFAFGPGNPAWFAGARPGLGSVHTPGPWTLGNVQEWIRARLVQDDAAALKAVERLESVAFDDGMLPEAYSSSGEERIRHWFAWPGAALAAVRLLDTKGALIPHRDSAAGWIRP